MYSYNNKKIRSTGDINQDRLKESRIMFVVEE